MNRSDFKQMLKRYIAGTASDSEKVMIDHWYELLYNDNIRSLNEEELAIVEQEIWQEIEQDNTFKHSTTIQEKTPVRNLFIRWVAAAAMLAGLIFGIRAILPAHNDTTAYQEGKKEKGLIEAVNTNGQSRKVLLPDGSTVTLQPLARLAYPNQFSSDKREVYLEGEAFFQVTKNPAKPFLVHSGNLLTQVLGTSFTIKPDKISNKITVAVKTGKVAVFEDNNQVKLNTDQLKNNGAIITPNQKVIYDAGSRNFITSLVENPEPVIIESKTPVTPSSFSFNDANLATVLDAISKVYEIDIMVENELIYHCLFTGNLSQQTLYEKLDLICQSTGHQYEIKGTKILIKGKGCQ
ncbi:FecR family protein [Sediminibacterium soli]|uniref:FecR family protein n=1 Tax=Sediminibacterium soli TaxID=2698829 RepID=UPI00137A25B1|nr:FecR family protein [Sediminibacterium soli]NCI48138.1 FecR family protein [Sediminibacterium soli]